MPQVCTTTSLPLSTYASRAVQRALFAAGIFSGHVKLLSQIAVHAAGREEGTHIMVVDAKVRGAIIELNKLQAVVLAPLLVPFETCLPIDFDLFV